ncbi:nucleotide-binding universal stress UspA family protein [Mucilaginibacter frigoritolerans]|uniref:Nucleotide-binding universal stress UspA family protein n=1 Tax=Mucilaginibacter frigoritolerans TaxID=652788 RepID=A0A562U4B4_9SPHI|nr:universal stress protein [Mucilaginibacter frigoritolerans]TWJ00662.1 nucleotide-binding universal stress UspA family protein [Mucilaginibacter frigoritolerans]
MKTLLLTTDFSESSKQAVQYGYDMARQIEANVLLCSAMIVPAEIPQSSFVCWPPDEFDNLIEDCKTDLDQLKKELESTVPPESYKPKVICISKAGRVSDVIKGITENLTIDLIVLGTHKGGVLSGLLVENHTNTLIDNSNQPLLLVKPGTVYKQIRKIAFATEFKNIDNDLNTIYRLIEIAKPLNAKILLTHITNYRDQTDILKKRISDCLIELSNKADYPNIYYRLIDNKNIEDGLEWLCGRSQVDILAMAHKSRNLFAELFERSHTKKMADLSTVPLLIFKVTNQQ